MSTTDAGRLGEAKVLVRLTELGWYPFTDVSGKCPVDIIAWKNGIVKTFQVKATSNLNKAGSYVASIGSIRSNRTSNTIHRFDPASCDYLVVYVAPTDKVYFIPTEGISNGRELHISAKHDIFLEMEGLT